MKFKKFHNRLYKVLTEAIKLRLINKIIFIVLILISGALNVNASVDTSDYEILQSAEIYSQAGLGGFSILADFGDEAPGKIYASRTTVNVPLSYEMPFIPHSSVSVTDPEGNLAAFYDFTAVSDGVTEIELSVDYAMEGIWQIRFVSGRKKDIGKIGINGAEYWGIRGECILGVTDTTHRTGYIYVPETVSSLFVGATSSNGFSVKDGSGKEVITPTANQTLNTKYSGGADGLLPGVYKIDLADNFTGGLIVDIAPSLICPTAEAAEKLRGGWIEYEGVLCQGILQAKARKELLRLIDTKNFDVTFTKPVYNGSVESLKNPLAEAQLFGKYGAVTPVYDQLSRQNFDRTSPYLGTFDSADLQSFETGTFNLVYDQGFSALVNMPAELNAFYNNEALINRTAVSLLGSAVGISEDFMIREGTTCHNYPTTHGNFAFETLANSYADIRDKLETKTTEILDKIFLRLAEKQGNYRGQGPSNQWFFTTNALTGVYKATGEKHIYDMITNHVMSIAGGSTGVGKGQSPAGYFIEGGGCDGDYNNLSQHQLFSAYENLKQINPKDNNAVRLKPAIRKSLEFDSLFKLTVPDGMTWGGPNSFTARKTNMFGKPSHSNYALVMDEFPLAKAMWMAEKMPEDTTGTLNFPYHVNTTEWARRVINRYYKAYDKSIADMSSSGSLHVYDAYRNVENAESALLPCEYEAGIWEKPGIIAVKHKGLYMNVFYDTSEGSIPDMSFMGGGMTQLWSEDTGVAVLSKKHKGYENLESAGQIKATCMYGNLTDGSFFATGKERSQLSWTMPEKEFEISSHFSNGLDFYWKYTLTDEGIKLTAGCEQQFYNSWLNIPLPNGLGGSISWVDDKIYYYYGDNAIEFSTGNEYEIVTVEDVDCLRIKLARDKKAVVNIRIVDNKIVEGVVLGGYEVVEGIDSAASVVDAFSTGGGIRSIQAELLNYGETDINTDIIYAMYSDTGRFLGASILDTTLEARQKNVVSVGLINDAAEVKVMILDRERTIRPLCKSIDTGVRRQ